MEGIRKGPDRARPQSPRGFLKMATTAAYFCYRVVCNQVVPFTGKKWKLPMTFKSSLVRCLCSR